MSTDTNGHLVEIFSSLEGEGICAGVKTIFVRFFGCAFECMYCDTPASRGERPASFPIHAPHINYARLAPNPTTVEKVIAFTDELVRIAGRHTRISLTGGEPLEQVVFCRALGTAFRAKGFNVSLETRGTHSEEMKRVRDAVDCVSMDIKIPSAARCEPLWDQHGEFIRALGETPLVFKVVADKHFADDEIEEVIKLVQARKTSAPVILQPVTHKNGSIDSRAVERLLDAQSAMLARLPDVRILPQIHPVLGLH